MSILSRARAIESRTWKEGQDQGAMGLCSSCGIIYTNRETCRYCTYEEDLEKCEVRWVWLDVTTGRSGISVVYEAGKKNLLDQGLRDQETQHYLEVLRRS